MESSRRDLSNDVAEHSFISKIYLTRFTPTRQSIP